MTGDLLFVQAFLLVYLIDWTRFKYPQSVPFTALLGIFLLRAICGSTLEYYYPHDFRL